MVADSALADAAGAIAPHPVAATAPAAVAACA
jgi:hypothetical protein